MNSEAARRSFVLLIAHVVGLLARMAKADQERGERHPSPGPVVIRSCPGWLCGSSGAAISNPWSSLERARTNPGTGMLHTGGDGRGAPTSGDMSTVVRRQLSIPGIGDSRWGRRRIARAWCLVGGSGRDDRITWHPVPLPRTTAMTTRHIRLSPTAAAGFMRRIMSHRILVRLSLAAKGVSCWSRSVLVGSSLVMPVTLGSTRTRTTKPLPPRRTRRRGPIPPHLGRQVPALPVPPGRMWWRSWTACGWFRDDRRRSRSAGAGCGRKGESCP
jgi:hypothetical protein